MACKMKILISIIDNIYSFLEFIFRWWPGTIGVRCRLLYYKNKLAACGDDVRLYPGCYLKGYKNIYLGENISFLINGQIIASETGEEKVVIGNCVGINSNVMINAGIGGEIIIGNNVLIGPNVVLRASNHEYSDPNVPIMQQGHKPGKIVLEDDVWLGANVVVLPDVRIGKGSVVAAGAVVTKNVESFSVVGGVPAKLISKRTAK